MSPDGDRWVLLNASPDLGQQLSEQPRLWPRHGLRHTPLSAVLLTDGQLDHVSGLLSLREGPPVQVYCTPSVFEDLTTRLPVLPILEHYCGVHWQMLPIAGDRTTAEFQIDAVPGLTFRALAVAGRAPPYSPHRNEPSAGDHIALLIEDTVNSRSLFYAPGLSHIGQPELMWMRQAECVMVDGTYWSEYDTHPAGLGIRSATDMGHLPQTALPGRPGMIAALDQLGNQRKLLIHINNTNPILEEDSDECLELRRHGIEVAHDGMEIEV